MKGPQAKRKGQEAVTFVTHEKLIRVPHPVGSAPIIRKSSYT